MGGELAPLAAGAGVFAILATIIAYLLGSNRADRVQYEESLGKAEQRADAAERRADEWITRFRDLQGRIDAEREARRSAEDRAAVQTREVGRLSAEVASLRAEMEKLRTQLTGGGLP